jgi:hypothetical protein
MGYVIALVVLLGLAFLGGAWVQKKYNKPM